MRGEVALEEVYGRRLALVRPNRRQIARLGQRYIETMVPDAREAVAALRSEGVQVRVISGGLRPAVVVLARELELDDHAVSAVDVYFDDDGEYAGFDATSPLTASGGKRKVIESWGDAAPRPIMLVGDGATDQEAQDVVDTFVAFAGVTLRPAVVAAAHVVIRACSLAPVLPLALGGRLPASPADRALFERGLAVLDNYQPTHE